MLLQHKNAEWLKRRDLLTSIANIKEEAHLYSLACHLMKTNEIEKVTLDSTTQDVEKRI